MQLCVAVLVESLLLRVWARWRPGQRVHSHAAH